MFLVMLYCCWRESVRPLQCYCHSLPLFYIVDERQLLFFRHLLNSSNDALRTILGLPRYSM